MDVLGLINKRISELENTEEKSVEELGDDISSQLTAFTMDLEAYISSTQETAEHDGVENQEEVKQVLDVLKGMRDESLIMAASV